MALNTIIICDIQTLSPIFLLKDRLPHFDTIFTRNQDKLAKFQDRPSVYVE